MKVQGNRFIVWLKAFLKDNSNDTVILKGHDGNKSESNQKLAIIDLLKLTSTFTPPEFEGPKTVWDKLDSRISKNKTISLQSRKVKRWYFAAASIAILISAGSFITLYKTSIYCERGQQKSYFLPDSSEVILNAETEIKFNKFTYKWNRKLELNGEAYFKVKKGSSFEVSANNTVTEVLGTSFNIYSRDNDLRVSCFTGKVGVRIVGQKENKILTPGYQTEIIGESKLSVPSEIKTKEEDSWRLGKFVFVKAPLNKVFKELERQFDVSIKYPDLEGNYYTGHFYNNNLTEALTMVCVPMQLKYEEKKNNIIIINKTSSN